jgi:transcriptional regulator with XRE-family HTH domain
VTTTATATPVRRRAALGEFLKARRARVTPDDVGLPPGSRRRTAGLRREEVALLAGVGVTWYTWLEQGRPINASSQVLDSVARTLGLNQVERQHLYRLAEAAPRHSTAPSTVPQELHEMLRALDPLPASLINERFDVIARNAAQVDLFWFWHGAMPCAHTNTLWCAFADPRGRETFLNFDEEMPHIVARLRAEYAKHVGESEWEDDIRLLCERSPDFAELWARHEVAAPAARVRKFQHPDAGLLSFVNTELLVPSEGGLRVSVYTPMDEETRERVKLTRRHTRQAA